MEDPDAHPTFSEKDGELQLVCLLQGRGVSSRGRSVVPGPTPCTTPGKAFCECLMHCMELNSGCSINTR